jgi:hypothetical protein
MKDEKGISYRVSNPRSQPVELHLGGRVLVVPPYGQAEVSQSEAAAPQLKLMARHGMVALASILPPASALEQPAPKEKPRSRKKAKASTPDKAKPKKGASAYSDPA